MTIPISDALLTMLREIVLERRSEDEWALIESDDMFQGDGFEGGFDATERAFCFGCHDAGGREYWFQLTLAEVERLVAGEVLAIEARPLE